MILIPKWITANNKTLTYISIQDVKITKNKLPDDILYFG